MIAGAGPQYTELEQGGYFDHWSLSARVQLRYKFAPCVDGRHVRKIHFRGIGLFRRRQYASGAPWYTRVRSDAPGNSLATWATPITRNFRIRRVGVAAGSYDEGSAGAVFRKHLGRLTTFLPRYRFSEVAFNVPVTIEGNTGRIAQRHIGTMGVEWHPTPTRIE